MTQFGSWIKDMDSSKGTLFIYPLSTEVKKEAQRHPELAEYLPTSVETGHYYRLHKNDGQQLPVGVLITRVSNKGTKTDTEDNHFNWLQESLIMLAENEPELKQIYLPDQALEFKDSSIIDDITSNYRLKNSKSVKVDKLTSLWPPFYLPRVKEITNVEDTTTIDVNCISNSLEFEQTEASKNRLDLYGLAVKNLPSDWLYLFESAGLTSELVKISSEINKSENGSTILPSSSNIFRAFQLCPLEQVKVVILGQDPYPIRGDANGLAFSVSADRKVPRSLQNIYTALENDPDVDFTRPNHGTLDKWVEQGVLLINTALTIGKTRNDSKKSHLKIWKPFTDKLIETLDSRNIIFVLWGGPAKQKNKLIRHSSVLTFCHPSPMAGDTFSTKCRHFSEINKLLSTGQIDWNL